MLLDEKMDHGPILASYGLLATGYEKWPPKAYELEETLAREGGKLLAEVLPKWVSDSIEAHEQDHQKATYTKKIIKEDGEISLADIERKPRETFLKIRAYDPWPGTYFFVKKNGKRLRVKIKDAVFENGILKITRVVPDGGKEMDYGDFMRGV